MYRQCYIGIGVFLKQLRDHIVSYRILLQYHFEHP